MKFIGQVLLIFAVASSTISQNNIVYFDVFRPELLLSERFYNFDLELLTQVVLAEPEGNFLLSPFSIKSTLAMILEGAVGVSAKELRDALRLIDDKVYMREQFKNILDTLKTDPSTGVTLKIANRVFMLGSLHPLDNYSNILKKYYNSSVTKLNSASPEITSAEINNWVSSATEGLIPTIISAGDVTGQEQVLLASALYFNGIWENAFDETKTTPKCFKIHNDDCYLTPTMELAGDFKFDEIDDLNAKVLELPYKGGEFSMILILPNELNGIQLLARDLRNSINSIAQKLNETEIFITLPRFKISYTTDLVPHLRKLHINSIFGANAVLTDMVANTKVSVSNILHKTTIEVNEKGAIAAAVTGAVVIPLMGNTKPRFIANHPFLFFIRHIPTGTILFEGRVREPELYVGANNQQNKRRRPENTGSRFAMPIQPVVYTNEPQLNQQVIIQNEQRLIQNQQSLIQNQQRLAQSIPEANQRSQSVSSQAHSSRYM